MELDMSAVLAVLASAGLGIWASSMAIRAVLLAVPSRDARS
jgi:hypothetical protein